MRQIAKHRGRHQPPSRAGLEGPLGGTTFVPLALVLLHALPVRAASQEDPRVELLAGLRESCVSCHGEEEVRGRVDLARFLSSGAGTDPLGLEGLGGEPALLQRMIEALRHEEMPPPEQPRPDPEQLSSWIQTLEELLERSLAAGRGGVASPLRRMNRFEYSNAVRDLFELDVNLFSLPEAMVRPHDDYFQPGSGRLPDSVEVGNRSLGKSQLIEERLEGVHPFPQDPRAEHGFNNRGDHLSLSPILMESFLSLGESIVGADSFPRRCGIWERFFEAPPAGLESTRELTAERLRWFLRRAFRGQVEEELLERYLDHHAALLAEGVSYEDGMRALAAAALVSPRFLYLHDSDTPESSIGGTEHRLASRLSFYLWSSIPDGELLDLADQGRLSDPEVLRGQVERMTRHPRIKGFCDSFPAQWLQLDRLVGARPDRERFPEYYFANFGKFVVGIHMQLEPLLLFEACLVEDLPVLTLVDPDFSYRTDMLHEWYERGSEARIRNQPAVITYRRRELEDSRYGGVITNAAVMTMTSSPLRSQPISRGAWVSAVVFNDPPDPPPAVVPPLEEDDEVIESSGKTLRASLEEHRSRPDCAACHRKIDPLGFALENYDPLGRWRDSYRTGLPVDSSGQLFGKHPFRDAVGLKQAIVLEEQSFTRGLAEHLLSYALGRELGPLDGASIELILERTAARGHGLRAMIEEVALCPAVVGAAQFQQDQLQQKGPGEGSGR